MNFIILVENIYIPAPTNEKEAELAVEITELCKSFRTEIIFYAPTEIIKNDNFSIFPQLYLADDTEKKNALVILYEDEFYTYLSSGMLTGRDSQIALPLIYDCNTLILGAKGRDYSDYRFGYKLNNLSELIVSSGGVIIPADVLEYYSDTEIKYKPGVVDFIR